MNEEEKKAIEVFDMFIKRDKDEISEIENLECDYYDEELDLLKRRVKYFSIVLNLIEKQQAELDKKEKIIKAMENEILYGIYKFKNKKQIKEYFEKKVGEE